MKAASWAIEAAFIFCAHSYNITFSPPPTAEDGYATFAEAKAGAAYNNALITIDDDIPSITIDGVTLGVDKTKVVCTEEGPWQLNYTYTGDETMEADWISNDGVAQTNITCTQPGTDDKRIVTITVNSICETVHRGTIRIKAGRLVRYIKVISLDEFEFIPTWVSNGIYNGNTKEDVALVFDIPSTYPEELLPVRCLITTNQGNGIMELSVINEEDCLKEKW